jgi:hypothetical protein
VVAIKWGHKKKGEGSADDEQPPLRSAAANKIGLVIIIFVLASQKDVRISEWHQHVHTRLH